MKFVAGGTRATILVALCCYCTNGVLLTHINLKVVCSVSRGICTPRSMSPAAIQSAVVWVILIIIVCACRHSSVRN